MQKRIKIVFYFFSFIFFAIFLKLFYWQIIESKRLTVLALDQYQGWHEIPSERGKIYTSDHFPIVLNKNSYLLYVNPQKLILKSGQLEEKLNTILVNKIKINEENLTDKHYLWIPLVKNITEIEKKAIEKLSIEGLGFEERDSRFYPEASVSAHLLGFVGVDENGSNKGYFGLEGLYEDELKGSSGETVYEHDAIGRPIPLGKESGEKSIPGRNLVLNIDRTLQFFSEKRLIEGIKKTGAKSGWVVIMNPKNGAILSLSAYPNYNPEQYYSYDSELFRNPVISSDFEPGSIFKIITMSSAIDSGAISVNEKCTKCSGPRQIYDYSIKTWNEKYYPNSSMTDILIHSDNVGMIYVAEKLGLDKFLNYLKLFGFGENTGIDLQGEMSPVLRERGNWREIDVATSSFGQGIAVTPVQILSAMAAIANGGELYQPQVVKTIIEDSKEINIKPVMKRRVVSAQTANKITVIMEKVVETNAQKLKPDGFRLAAKSGTAQIPVNGRYDPDKTIASYIGFGPTQDPRFVMLVTLIEPVTSQWSEATAAPIWFDITKDIIRLWGLQPTN